MASRTNTAVPPESRRYPVWARVFATLVAFGFGAGVGAAVVVGAMVAASKGWIRWVN